METSTALYLSIDLVPDSTQWLHRLHTMSKTTWYDIRLLGRTGCDDNFSFDTPPLRLAEQEMENSEGSS